MASRRSRIPAQTIAFGSIGAVAVIGNFQRAAIIFSLQSDAASLRLRVPNDVGHRLPQR